MRRILIGAVAGAALGVMVVKRPEWALFLLIIVAGILQWRASRHPWAVMALGRSQVYIQGMLVHVVMAALCVVIVVTGRIAAADMGLAVTAPVQDAGLGLAFAAVALVVMTWIERRLGLRDNEFVLFLLPKSARERLLFMFLSVTAGLAEELVFRGFLIELLGGWCGNLWVAVVLSSILFGLLHGYQGLSGVLRTGFLGLGLAALYVWRDSLLPVMVAHFASDVVAGMFLAPRDT